MSPEHLACSIMASMLETFGSLSSRKNTDCSKWQHISKWCDLWSSVYFWSKGSRYFLLVDLTIVNKVLKPVQSGLGFLMRINWHATCRLQGYHLWGKSCRHFDFFIIVVNHPRMKIKRITRQDCFGKGALRWFYTKSTATSSPPPHPYKFRQHSYHISNYSCHNSQEVALMSTKIPS